MTLLLINMYRIYINNSAQVAVHLHDGRVALEVLVLNELLNRPFNIARLRAEHLDLRRHFYDKLSVGDRAPGFERPHDRGAQALLLLRVGPLRRRGSIFAQRKGQGEFGDFALELAVELELVQGEYRGLLRVLEEERAIAVLQLAEQDLEGALQRIRVDAQRAVKLRKRQDEAITRERESADSVARTSRIKNEVAGEDAA